MGTRRWPSGKLGWSKSSREDRRIPSRSIDQTHFAASLDALHAARPFTLPIHGAAPGADSLAGAWAVERGIAVQAYPAAWAVHGKAAGPLRNQRMLDEGRPDLVFAFPGGRGTAEMVERATLAGVPVLQR